MLRAARKKNAGVAFAAERIGLTALGRWDGDDGPATCGAQVHRPRLSEPESLVGAHRVVGGGCTDRPRYAVVLEDRVTHEVRPEANGRAARLRGCASLVRDDPDKPFSQRVQIVVVRRAEGGVNSRVSPERSKVSREKVGVVVVPKLVNGRPLQRLASLVDGHSDSGVELGDDLFDAASEVRLRLRETHEDVPRVFVDCDARVLFAVDGVRQRTSEIKVEFAGGGRRVAELPRVRRPLNLRWGTVSAHTRGWHSPNNGRDVSTCGGKTPDGA